MFLALSSLELILVNILKAKYKISIKLSFTLACLERGLYFSVRSHY